MADVVKVLSELAKCVLVCANCHGEVHDGLVDAAGLDAATNKSASSVSEFSGMSWREIGERSGLLLTIGRSDTRFKSRTSPQ